ncbi:MAG: hypothetical protein HGA44_02050 [Cellulomonadaceae bacterium]|nr:hypothetical protein [Cellulomonadaceae bacterium]
MAISSRRSLLTAVGACVVVGLLAGCPPGEPTTPTSSPAATESPSTPTPTTEPSPTATATADQAVYFMTDTGLELRLVRELVAVADPTVQSAVEQMIEGPTDPDYISPWNPSTQVLGVSQSPTGVVVDLSADALTANIGSAGAGLMLQQLAYTVSSAAGDPSVPVGLTIEGTPPTELWGAIDYTGPVTRADPISVRLLVQIDEPREGATSGSPVTVSGEAAVFEATLPWKVLDGSGTEVASGVTMTAEGQTFAPFSFTVDLDPGTYTVVITEDDPSDGAGRPPMTDSRTVTVS